MNQSKSNSLTQSLAYRAGLVSLLSLYLFFFMEWLFFATKTSFLDSYPLIERLLSLWGAPLLVAPLVMGLTFLSACLYYFVSTVLGFKLRTLLVLVPVTVITALTVLLADNFSNTVFGLGIRNTSRTTSLVILIGIAGIWIMWRAWFIQRVTRVSSRTPLLLAPRTAFLLLGISALCLIAMYTMSDHLENRTLSKNNKTDLPNIIFFAADGIQASHMSTYGYHRKTTPKIDELSKSSLVVFNAVSNSGRTTGATTALLTGKYPTTTKVIFPPHVLRDRHIYQHLPGILKELGYQNIQETVRYYADALDLNMYGAFDFANDRAISQADGTIPQEIRYKLFPAFVLIQKVRERISSRIQHLLGIQIIKKVSESVNPEKIAKIYGTPDKERIENVLGFFRKHEGPVFAHIHLMDTHCCNHRPDVQVFSKGQKKISRKNYVDFYDDIILETDLVFGQFIDELKAMGKFDNSLIVYSSDHTRGWHTNKSVPLIIKFPREEHAGNRYGAHQLIDVAPTIVDYLGLPIPEWMEGISLLHSEQDIERELYTVDSIGTDNTVKRNELDRLAGSGAPFFGVEVASLVACGQNYYLNINTGDFQKRPFVTQGKGCDEPVNEDLIKSKLENHLQERGFSIPYLQ